MKETVIKQPKSSKKIYIPCSSFMFPSQGSFTIINMFILWKTFIIMRKKKEYKMNSLENLQHWMQTNQLVRIIRLNKKAPRTQVVGRIVKVDTQNQYLLLYDDDFKDIRTMQFNEIDDISSEQ